MLHLLCPPKHSTCEDVLYAKRNHNVIQKSASERGTLLNMVNRCISVYYVVLPIGFAKANICFEMLLTRINTLRLCTTTAVIQKYIQVSEPHAEKDFAAPSKHNCLLIKHKQPLNSVGQLSSQNCIQQHSVNSSPRLRAVFYAARRFQIASM